MNTDRDPTNPEALTEAVKAWLDVHDHAWGKATDEECDEADVVLEAAMADLGIVCPEDVVQELTPNGDRIMVLLDSGEAFALTNAGEVTTDL